MTRIERFGWRGAVEPGIGRVVSAHGDYYHLVCNEAEGEILARKKKSAFGRMKTAAPDDMKGAKKSELQASEPLKPITGDFVRFRHNAQGDSMILEVLPRFSHFERRDPAARRTLQTLAVNFDTLFIMMSLNENFSTARIDRYLALAEDIGGGEAVVALTKMDLREDGDEKFIDELVETIAGRAPLLMISALTGEGMDVVREYAKPGATLAFIGSSGVGKSTLLNALAGEEWAATQEIQEWSGKGRHTTTSRELVMLPSGAMVIDTPGVREIGMVGETDQVVAKGVSTHRWRRKGQTPVTQ
ncbi:MAG: GTPase RsgA [Kiritimatiellae bacterium]|nr:GTPase RsgA [Kiritimatiellia bacterium]